MLHGFLLDSGTGDASGAPGGENQGLLQTELLRRLVHVSILLKVEQSQFPSGFRCLPCSAVKTLVRFPFLQKTHIQAARGKTAALLGQLWAGWTSVQQMKESGTRADPKFLGRTPQRTRPG